RASGLRRGHAQSAQTLHPVNVPYKKPLYTPNVSITCPPYLAIREDLKSATAGKFRAAYPPPKAGRVHAWLGGSSEISRRRFP
ncbi:MAG: hypothetical protein D6694_03505, partial [Gammaproteobacteria bacterium]